ncbi:MAG: hypothetical protein D6734_05440 [Candidatus Schekmanbacteria bacterium]|nr:MAG: hypothetical protein D6734_05440 [Candidatus Schekmanbacteria bacterium]
MQILIDGYNLIGIRWGLESAPLEILRERLLKELAEYKRIKKCNIEVVFDGENAGWISEGRDRIMGIDIYYSRDGEKADELICRMVSKGTKNYILVTSDNEIISRCERYGALSVKSEEFIQKMKEAAMYDGFWTLDDEEDEVNIRKMTKKKGNPKRLSKKERQRRQRIKKI